MAESRHPASESYSHVNPFIADPTVPASTQGTSRSERGAAQTPSGPSDSDVHPASPQQQPDRQNHELKPTTRTPTAVRRNVEEASTHPEEAAAPGGESSTQSLSEQKSAENRTEDGVASDQLPPPSEGPDPEEPEQTHSHPNMVEPLSDHRGSREYTCI